jgi:antitoxin component YwqK of YwqJK toxin-antitoxin module
MAKYLSIFILFLFSFYNQAQDIEKDLYLNHTLKQDGESYQFTVLDSDKKGVFFYDKSKFYFWYKAQKVITTQGGSSGQLLNGKFESFYDNKQLSKKGSFKKGLKNGEWMYWRKDGTLIKMEHWKNGIKKGKEIDYNEKGIEISTLHFKRNNYKKTTADSLIISNLENTKQTITIFDKAGNVISKSKVKNGVVTDVTKTKKAESTSEEKPTEKKSFFSKFKKEKSETKQDSKSKKINWKFWQKKKVDAK